MSFLDQWLDPSRRFERTYADQIARRYRFMLWPLARVDLARDWIEPRGLRAALTQNARVVITGAPGAGKTTALAYLAMANARGQDRRARVPIFLAARELQSQVLPRIPDLPRGLNLSDALAVQCPRIYFPTVFKARRALVLIDDADALTPEQLNIWQKDFADATIIATARAALPGFTEFALPGLRDSDIEIFARRMENPSAFFAALKNAPRALTANPFTLTMLTRIWREGEPLPTRRTDLFDSYAQLVLGGQDDVAKSLETLALAIQNGRAGSNELLSKSRGLLRAAKNRTAEFVHELWQAYFAGRALRNNAEQTVVFERMADARWEDALLFYAGLGDASAFADSAFARGDVYFAGRILAHARDARADLRDAVTQELVARVWNGDARAGRVLAEMNSDAAVDGFAAKLKDKDPAVRTRAAEILGALQLDRGIEYLLPQLRDVNADVRDQVVAALGCARTDRVIEPLLVALRGDARVGHIDTRLRIAAARALGAVGSDRAVPALLVDLQVGEPEVRAVAADALKQITSPLMAKPLHALLQSEDELTRQYATEILALVNGKN
jgi:hypothetical protein